MRDSWDIVVCGGGIAGLTAAAAFGSAGYSVLCMDPAAPVTEAAAPGADMRTTALLQPAIPVLDGAGVWTRLAPHATALKVMRIVDAGGPKPVARVSHEFDSADLSDQPFGWNLPNWLLRRELLARIAELPSVTFRPGVAATGLLTRTQHALLRLSDGARVQARLAVAADGRDSALRRALDIPVRTVRYGQKALAFAVTHPMPHDNVSTEVHRAGGPFTLVPLPDRDGAPCSAVVWMETGPEVARLQALPIHDFEAAMSERSAYVLGPLKLASRVSVWPIISQIAARFAAERVALMAEAAHVVPPIGAQGLNMSLADLRVLLELAQPQTLGEPAMLDAYHRRRWPEAQARVAGVDLLNRASMMGAQPLRDLRAGALDALYSAAPVRRGLMHMGMGLR